MRINANTFVCALSKQNQKKIEKLVREHFLKEKYDEEKINEIVISVRENRLWTLGEIINIEQFFRTGNVIEIKEYLR